MQLIDLLPPDHIYICSDQLTKHQLLKLFSDQLEKHFDLSSAFLYEKFIDREKSASTALGNGIALPHLRLANIDKPHLMFFKLNFATDFSSIDNKPVDLVFTLLIPESMPKTHLEILSQIAELFISEDFRNSIRQCKSIDEIYQNISTKNITQGEIK